MAEEDPQEGAEWAREFLRRAETLARPDSRLEEVRRRMGRIARAVDAGERTPEEALEGVKELEEELTAHRDEHGTAGEPARERLAGRMLELVEELEGRIRRRRDAGVPGER